MGGARLLSTLPSSRGAARHPRQLQSLLASRARTQQYIAAGVAIPAGRMAFSLWPWASGSPQKPAAETTTPNTATEPIAPGTTAEPLATASTAAPAVDASPPNDAVAATPPPPSPSEMSLPDIDLSASSSLLDMPEHIGYLNEMGIHFGWGTTSILQWCLEHVHIYSGMPWWGSILAITVVFRVLMVKPSVVAQQQSERVAALNARPDFIAAKEAMDAANRKGGHLAAAQHNQVIMRHYKEVGFNPLKALGPLIQLPFAFGMYRLLSAMSEIPLPGLENGGLLWFMDLSVRDPLYILPLTTFGFMYLNLVVGFPSISSPLVRFTGWPRRLTKCYAFLIARAQGVDTKAGGHHEDDDVGPWPAGSHLHLAPRSRDPVLLLPKRRPGHPPDIRPPAARRPAFLWPPAAQRPVPTEDGS